MIVHLGVLDVIYEYDTNSQVLSQGPTKTTGDVAQWLENKYGVIEHFFKLYDERISGAFEEEMQGALENVMLGAPAMQLEDALAGATSKIEGWFRYYLSSLEAEGVGMPGVPTAAALKGVNHRLKIKRGARRPSFIDTGLYEASFKVWI